ncbi:hypothetical protein MLD38_027266 [Melastoma candidum]|uniref:Uncharacterized protein n=1 Tax=Melastoma candidum TaxID=119954 RepID=A0ACB9P101_9MYRT|nr:hypothetical protein MLD38_027266 [Melastoma candidum]
MGRSVAIPMIQLSLLLILLSLHEMLVTVQGQQPPWKLCPKQLKVPGTCPSDTGQAAGQCAAEFLNQFGAGAMPQKCSCRPAGSDERICRCSIVCQ